MAKASNERPAVRAPVYGAKLVAVTGHNAATQAAIDVHLRGGNLIDAAIAASSTLAVAVSQATSIGGDCFVHEQALGRVAHARTLDLGVDHDVEGHVEVG